MIQPITDVLGAFTTYTCYLVKKCSLTYKGLYLLKNDIVTFQLDVSDNGHVWGVNSGGNIYRWTGRNWQHIGGRAKQVTVGPSGVWVVNRGNNIYYRRGTYGDRNTAGSGVCWPFEYVMGKCNLIEML